MVSFDCYGTLIDWRAGIESALGKIFGAGAAGRGPEIFEAYVQDEAEEEAGPYRPYRQVLAAAVERLGLRFSLDLRPGRSAQLAEMLPGWKPFRDTNPALTRLKTRFRLGVLSNVDRDLFAGTARAFDVPFDFVVTAEDVRSYKPALGHFQRMMEFVGGGAGIVHVGQSPYHDGRAAQQVGIPFVWINRYADRGDPSVHVLAEFPDLKSFADAVERNSLKA